MFTSIDKALAALVMAVIFLVNNFTSLTLNIGPETVNAVIGVLTPLLVYLVPNKPATP